MTNKQTYKTPPDNGDNVESKGFVDSKTMQQLSTELFDALCKQTKTRKNDLTAIRDTIRGYITSPTGEQPLRDYINSEAFDKQSVLMGMGSTLAYVSGWLVNADSSGSERIIDLANARSAVAVTSSAVCDMVDVPDGVSKMQDMLKEHLDKEHSYSQIIRIESLDARSVAAGGMLALAVFENINKTAPPIIPFISEIMDKQWQMEAPRLINNKAAHAKALKESWGTLQFTLFILNASDQQKEEVVLRYNALIKQCKLPPGADMVGIDDPDVRHPLLMEDVINIIKHIEGINQLVDSAKED